MHVDVIPLRLRIGGFRVIAVDERDEMVEVVIETVSPESCCPHCGHADAVAKERKQLVVRDVPLRPGKQTWLLWHKRRFSCARYMRTFTETHDEIPPASLSATRIPSMNALTSTVITGQ